MFNESPIPNTPGYLRSQFEFDNRFKNQWPGLGIRRTR